MSNDFSLDLDQLPKELKFLLKIIESGENEQIIDLEKLGEMDWNLFLELTIHHRLYPLLYSKIKMIDQEFLPAYVAQTIFREYRKNTFQMLHLSAVMEEVSKLFAENDLRLLVLKGPVLATDLYGDLSLRTCNDLDLLVPINDLEKIDKLLLSQGYVQDDLFQIDTTLNDWRWRHHHIAYFHSEKGVKLEVHWRLNPGPGKEPTFNELWERRRISSLTTHPVFYLGREDLFFLLITHGARHGWSRLRWLVDIHKIVGQRMNWSEVIKRLKEYQFLHLGGQALLLSSSLLKTPILEEMMSLFWPKSTNRLAKNTMFYLERMVNLHTEPLPKFISKYHERYLFSLLSNRNKFLYLISIFYPSITDVKTLRLPKSLYALYFPLRPIFLILRKTRKQPLS